MVAELVVWSSWQARILTSFFLQPAGQRSEKECVNKEDKRLTTSTRTPKTNTPMRPSPSWRCHSRLLFQ